MENSSSDWKDRMGIAASALCAVHCAATPILLVFLPTLQFTEWMASPLFHQIAAAVCVGLVGISIIPAYRKHRDVRVLSFSGAGLAMILAAAFLLPDYCCQGGHAHGSNHSITQSNASDHSADATGLKLVSNVNASASDECTHANCKHSHAPKIAKAVTVKKPVCTHEGCTHSHGKTESVAKSECCSDDANCCDSGAPHSDVMAAGLSGNFWAVVQPWMTPIGGLLLMIAHGLNMKRAWGSCSTRCGCSPGREEIAVQSV